MKSHGQLQDSQHVRFLNKAEKDYVHLCMDAILQKTPASFALAQVADWERNYKSGNAKY